MTAPLDWTHLYFCFFKRKIEKLVEDTEPVLAKYQQNMYKLSCIVFLDHSMISICILSSSDTISMVLFKVIFQIYLKRWNLYKTDTSLRRTLGHSPKVSVLRGSTVHLIKFLFLKVNLKCYFNKNRTNRIRTA